MAGGEVVRVLRFGDGLAVEVEEDEEDEEDDCPAGDAAEKEEVRKRLAVWGCDFCACIP